MEATIDLISQRQKILVDAALYECFDLTSTSDEDLSKFVLGPGAVQSFCVECKQMSIFRQSTPGYSDEAAKKIPRFGVIKIEAQCSHQADNYNARCDGKLHICFYRDGDRITKIGQYPSKGDLDFASLDPVFNQELDKDLRRELGCAIGLRAHGVGIGSFVYLRRIFEKLIEEAHSLAASDKQWKESAYLKARIPERIKMLKAHLPNRLVENARLYEILSKGIHELSEEECLRHFDIVQKAILMILRERHDEREHQKLVKNLNQQADKLKQKQTSN
jgi:hypothetical protein